MKKFYLFLIFAGGLILINNSWSYSQLNLLSAEYAPGFELGNIDEWTNYGPLAISDAEARTGSYSMFDDTDDGGGFLHVTGLTGGVEYTVSAWVKGVGGLLAVATFENDTTIIDPWLTNDVQSSSADDWEQLSYTFTLPENANSINLITWAKGSVYFDDLGLVKGPDPFGSPFSGNFLDEEWFPGFEDGNIDLWTNYGPMIISDAQVHSGDYSVFIDTQDGGGFLHVPGLIGGKDYTFSAWIYGPESQLAVATFQNDSIRIDPWISDNIATETDEWVFREYTFPLKEQCNAVNLILWAKAPIYVDDIGLSLASENTAMRTFRNDDVVKIYPNPVSDILNMELTSDNSRILILNSVGQIMLETTVQGRKASVEVSDLPGGMYFLKVNNDAVMKFVK